jgi:hypothetical protein
LRNLWRCVIPALESELIRGVKAPGAGFAPFSISKTISGTIADATVLEDHASDETNGRLLSVDECAGGSA